VGARALDLFVAWRFYAEDPRRIAALDFAGFSVYGGLIAAAVAGVLLARAVRLDRWRLADHAIPELLLGEVLMRTGCFLNGCCFGVPTDLPWGVRFRPGTPAWMHELATGSGGLFATLAGEMRPVHPTQVYEALGALLVAAVALMLARRGAPAGVPFLAYAIGFTLVRFGNHFLRARINTVTAPEWFYPMLYATALAVLGALLTVRLSRQKSRPGA
jgi:phosphatidylglycerol:prolipoprotein diacylglycerol transferase